MNDMKKPAAAAASASLQWPMDQLGSEVAQRLLDCTQSVANAVSDLNLEITQFWGHRIRRSNEAMSRMTGCTSVPQMFDAEARWLQEAFEDYSAEATRLAEVNSKMIGSMLGTGQPPRANLPFTKAPATATS
jgi:hypothetical protein